MRLNPGHHRWLHSAPLACLVVAACWLTLLPTPAHAGGFATPTTLRPPFPEDVTGPSGFGRALALDRGTLAVSAPGIDGGTIYLYQRRRDQPDVWGLAEIIGRVFLPGETAAGTSFGQAMALDGDTLVVGAPDLDRAYIFRRSRGRGWQLWRSLRPGLGGGSRFGAAVAISGQRVAVGAPGAARVLIYERNSPRTNQWGRTATLRGEVSSPRLLACLAAGPPIPGFGAALSLSGKRLAVGASEGPGGDSPPTAARDNGAYLFAVDRASPTGWSQVANLAPAFGCGATGFSTVSLDGPTLLWTNGVRWAVHERDRGGPDRWGWRTSRPVRTGLDLTGQALRGNAMALGYGGDLGARVFDRNIPNGARWGLVARLGSPEIPFTDRTAVAIGPREVVTGHPAEEVVQIFARQPILADDFETGTTGAWASRSGLVEVVGPGLGSSGAALAVTFGADPRPAFVASGRPRGEPSVSLSFTLQPDQIDLAGQPVEILRLLAGQPFLRVTLTQDDFGASYRVGFEARLRSGIWFRANGVQIFEGEERRINLEYRAATATGAADARVRLDADGRDVRQVRNLDMSRLFVNRVALGLPAGSSADAGGTFLIDDFEMHR